VPYSVVPDVSAQTRQPADYFTQQATPADFGAQVGAANQNLGKNIEQAGTVAIDAATQLQIRHNNIKTDDAYQQMLNLNNTVLQGNPDVPGDTGYFGMRGKDAVNGRAAALQLLDSGRQSILGGLENDAQKLAFDEQSRRLLAYSNQRIGDHYEQQYTEYGKQNAAAIQTGLERSVGIDYDNDAHFQKALVDAQANADKQSALEGASDEVFQQNRITAGQGLLTARAVAMGTQNPSAGLAFVQKNASQFDPMTLHRLTQEFKTGSDQQAVAGAVNNVMASPIGMVAYPTSASIDQLQNAIHGQESGGAATAPTSVTGARGGYQIQPATFQMYAEPGENIDNPTDNANVAKRVITDLYQKAGGDPARVAVGYFAGPQNIAPPGSVTPWLADKSDPNGVKTSTYVNQVMARLGGSSTPPGAPTADPNAPTPHSPVPFSLEFQRMDAARQQAAQQFPNRPDLQKAVVEQVWSQIQQTNALQAKYEAEQAKATRDAQQAAGNQVMKQLLTDPKSFDPAALASNDALTWEQKNDLYNIAQRHLQESAGGKEAQTYGPGFWQAYQQVHSSDPTQKINDPSQLWSRGGPNGDLTLAGIDKLTAELQSSKSPEGAAYAEAQKSYLAAAHVAISGHGAFGGQRDAIGEMNFARFLPAAFDEMAKDRAAGMTAGQMLAKGSPLDLLVQQYKRSPAQMMRDMMGDSNLGALPGAPLDDGTPAPATPAKPADLTTKDGIAAAYKNGYFGVGPAAYDKAAAELMRRGLFKPPPATPSPAVPQVPVN
jgi:hypothetical protein